MAQKTLLPSDLAAILGSIDPGAKVVGTYTTDWITLANFATILAVVSAGDLGTNATLDAKLEQATDATGSDAKDIENAAITQLVQANGASDVQAILQCYAEDLDLANDFTHVRLSMTVAEATSDASGLILGMGPRYAPASNHNAASVSEVVTL